MGKLSIGTHKGPPIGVQKGPLFDARNFALVVRPGAVGGGADDQGGTASTRRGGQARLRNRQLSLPVSTMSQ